MTAPATVPPRDDAYGSAGTHVAPGGAPPGPPLERRRGRWLRPVAVAAALAVAFAAAWSLSPGFRREVLLSVTRQPTPFVELYFADDPPEKGQRTAGELVPVDFVIVNHDGRDVTYHWDVTVSDGLTSVVRDRGATVVPDGQTVPVRARVVLPEAHRTYAVIVALDAGAQTIHRRETTT